MSFIIKFVVAALIAMFLANMIPGIDLRGFSSAVMLVIVLSICNILIKPIVTFFTLPLTIFTLGGFLVIINVLMLYITDTFVAGFKIHNFISALIFSLLLSISTYVSDKLIEGKKEK